MIDFFKNHASLLNRRSVQFNKILILFSILVALFLPILIFESPSLKYSIAFLFILPIYIFIILKTELLSTVLIITTFTRLGFMMHYLSVLFVLPLTVSYILSYKKKKLNQRFTNPLSTPFTIYIISILPSLYNVTNYYNVFHFSFNFIAMFFVVIIISDLIKSHNQMQNFLITFLFMTFINGLHIIYLSIITGGERVFGFNGVVYIDFVNIAILSTFTILLYIKNKFHSFLLLFLISFYFISLILTQSRNSILSLAATSVSYFIILLIYSSKINIKRAKIFKISTAIIIGIIILFAFIFILFPQISSRFIELLGNSEKTETTSLVSNSLISRFLIWHTAYEAFIKHPFIGIGIFNFQFDSSLYYKIPTVLYKEYVQTLTGHETFITVLCETGIFGFIGFTTFLLSTITISFKALNSSQFRNQTYYSLGILILQIYVFFSMFMTDAWFFGQCGIIWSILIGLSIANYNIIKKSKVQND